MQSLWASYRARGGRYPKTFTSKLKLQFFLNSFHKIESIAVSQITKRPTSPQNNQQRNDDDLPIKDALDLKNHQRLCVLFCSFYFNPKATSSFCVQPSTLNMIFYGTYDIMLGKFLDYYCFRKTYMCSSCNLPMLDHVRR